MFGILTVEIGVNLQYLNVKKEIKILKTEA